MPARRYFIVTQERQVRIAAPEVLDAANGAAQAFAGQDLDNPNVEVRGPIVDRALKVEEER